MIVLAIIATLAALAGSFIVVGANMMSSSPSTPFQGGFLLLAGWAICVAFWFAWWVG